MTNRSSEFRQDLVTGNWIVVATGRSKRPYAFVTKKKKSREQKEELKDDPFRDPQATGHGEPLLVYPGPGVKDWNLQVIKNKFPAVSANALIDKKKIGPFSVLSGVGYHEVVVTRDPIKHLALLKLDRVKEVIGAYKTRFSDLRSKDIVKYISIFHNHGASAGASIAHPHSQIIAIPVIPTDIRHSLNGSKHYYRKYNKCVHCLIIAWEKKDKKRIIFENNDFIAFCPFISRLAFEIHILPKKHNADFDTLTSQQEISFAESLKSSLGVLNKTLNNPDYNFFIHTAPVKGGYYNFYHWHVEILPKTAIFAGFELGTGIEISTIAPEAAAKLLRDSVKV